MFLLECLESVQDFIQKCYHICLTEWDRDPASLSAEEVERLLDETMAAHPYCDIDEIYDDVLDALSA